MANLDKLTEALSEVFDRQELDYLRRLTYNPLHDEDSVSTGPRVKLALFKASTKAMERSE